MRVSSQPPDIQHLDNDFSTDSSTREILNCQETDDIQITIIIFVNANSKKISILCNPELITGPVFTAKAIYSLFLDIWAVFGLYLALKSSISKK